MRAPELPFFEGAGAAPGGAAEPPSPPLGAAAGPTTRGFYSLGSSSLRGVPLPLWILLAYLFVDQTYLGEEWASIGAWKLRSVLGALALLAAAWMRWGRGRAAPPPTSDDPRAMARSLVAFAIAGLFSMLWAFDPVLARETQLEHLTVMLGFALIVGIVRTRRDVLVTVLVLCLTYGFYLLRSFTEYLNGKHQYTMGVSRMMGAGHSYEDPNAFAATLAFALPFLVWAALRSRSWLLRGCVLAYGLLSVYSVIQTHSRSGLILLLLNVLFVFATLPGVKTRIALVVLLVGLGAVLVAGQTGNALDRYGSILSPDTYTKESSTVGRIEGYRVAWRMFNENPLLGVGPGCWAEYRASRVDGSTLMPHNLPGQLIATMGLAGTLAFVAYLLSIVSYAWNVRRRRATSIDPWDRAVRSLATVTLFTLLLLLVSGTAAHNVERPAWVLLPALLVAAARARAFEGSLPAEGSAPAGPPDDSPSSGPSFAPGGVA